jgi:hypothetical protein
VYDLDCANVSAQSYRNTMTKEHKSTWICVECKSRQPKGGNNTNTPVRPMAECVSVSVDSDNVTIRKSHHTRTITTSPELSESPVAVTAAPDRCEELAEFVAEMREFRREMAALRDSLTVRLDDFERRLGTLERRRDNSATERTAELERTVADLRKELDDRDREALLADLEIGQLPEEKGVSVVQSVTVLAARLGVPLEQQDVVFAERVGAPPAEAGGRPRRVVVRLTRRQLRDELLAAARVRRDLVGPGGGRVYLNERLTRTNRQLFGMARDECKRLRWRYVWTKHGCVYVHQAEGSPVYRLRSRNDVESVLGPLIK